MPQPGFEPQWAGARSSSPGAAWPEAKESQPLSSRLRPKHRSSRRWSWIWTSRPAFSPRSPSSSREVSRSLSSCLMQESWGVRISSSLQWASRCLRLRSIGHHQLTVGLLRANLLSPNARIVIASWKLPEGTYPLFQLHRCGGHRASQEAAWQAVVNVSGVEFCPHPASLSAVS